ncbi:unnamed protein product [Nippostrongylus brasiliensis]|uniref:PH domain-containing protein n=1 Tax=Nippostrongylus brasiliensis TaxID=27835 RepID=A0A158QZP4_NIPBR|nr:unnamed protein product [Nippostrongylus brasiliensis]
MVKLFQVERSDVHAKPPSDKNLSMASTLICDEVDSERLRRPSCTLDTEKNTVGTANLIKSKSLNDRVQLPQSLTNAIISSMLQVCFKRKRTFFKRTGRIRILQVCLTDRDELVIYKKKNKGLVLDLGSVKKTLVSTQSFILNDSRRVMICRYRLVFEFGTVNLFFANDLIQKWREAIDGVLDKYGRSGYAKSAEKPNLVTPPHLSAASEHLAQKSDNSAATSTGICEDRSDRDEDRLVPPMRKGYGHSPPPLPVNPPPGLSGTSCVKVPNSKTSRFPISVSQPQLEEPDDVGLPRRPAAQIVEVGSGPYAPTLKKTVASMNFLKPPTIKLSHFSAGSTAEPTPIPKKPPRGLQVNPVQKSPKSASPHRDILVKHPKRRSSARTMPPEQLAELIEQPAQLDNNNQIPGDNQLPESSNTCRRDTVRFSISSHTSVEELEESAAESCRSVKEVDRTQQSGYVVGESDSLLDAQNDDEWWRHSHIA